MVWKDVTFGFTVAGIIGAFVPPTFFQTLFLGTGSENPSFLALLENTIVGPVAAFFTKNSGFQVPRPSRTALYYNIGVRVTSNVGRTTTNLTNSIVKVRGFQHNPC